MQFLNLIILYFSFLIIEARSSTENKLLKWLEDSGIPLPYTQDQSYLKKYATENWQKIQDSIKNLDSEELVDYFKTQKPDNFDFDKLLEVGNKIQNALETSKNKVVDFSQWPIDKVKDFLQNNKKQISGAKDDLISMANNLYETLPDKEVIYKSWSDSDLKEWLDSNGYPSPQLTKRDEMIRMVRRYNTKLNNEEFDLRNKLEKAGILIPDSIKDKKGLEKLYKDNLNKIKESLKNNWPEKTIKEFLKSKKVQFDEKISKNDLMNLMKNYKNQPINKVSNDLDKLLNKFQGWSLDDLNNWATEQGIKLNSKQKENREELLNNLKSNYEKLEDNEQINQLLSKTNQFKSWTFDKWSESDLKEYLNRYTDKIPENKEEMISLAKQNTELFYDNVSNGIGSYFSAIKEYIPFLKKETIRTEL